MLFICCLHLISSIPHRRSCSWGGRGCSWGGGGCCWGWGRRGRGSCSWGGGGCCWGGSWGGSWGGRRCSWGGRGCSWGGGGCCCCWGRRGRGSCSWGGGGCCWGGSWGGSWGGRRWGGSSWGGFFFLYTLSTKKWYNQKHILKKKVDFIVSVSPILSVIFLLGYFAVSIVVFAPTPIIIEVVKR